LLNYRAGKGSSQGDMPDGDTGFTMIAGKLSG